MISPCPVANVHGVNNKEVLQLHTFIDNQEQWQQTILLVGFPGYP